MTDVIYESPDKGKTVYYRRLGSTERTLYSASTSPDTYKRWMNLKDIVTMAENDPMLNDLLSKLEMLYILKKKENSD